jgi:hypothetical protein
METLPLRQVIEQVESGQIRIPSFQRGFVWEPERVAHLMDSIYKRYPFGALLFWRAKEKLKSERKLGPFELPEPKADYPIDYVLDGQQRVTSIYAVFKIGGVPKGEENWKDIYFDFTIDDGVQEPQFFGLDQTETDPKKHFPLRVLFDSTAYRKSTEGFDKMLVARIDTMQQRFQEAFLQVEIFQTDDKGKVSVIFERINRQGVPLDTLQLLSAWTWSEDFQLQEQFEELVEEIEDKVFDADTFDRNILLRCASAVLVSDPRPEAIVKIPGEQVRNRFDEVLNGVLGALDFLQMNFNIRRIENIPFQTILVPLSVFYAASTGKEIVVKDDVRAKLVRWFWRVCFSRRYSSGVIRHLEEDIKEMLQLKGGQKSNLGGFTTEATSEFFSREEFGIGKVNTKTFVLLLADQKPLSLVSGQPIDLNTKLKEYNKTEFHHLMPRAYVKTLNGIHNSVNSLSNYAFLSRSENKHLGGVMPSKYKEKMAQKNLDEILARAVCPKLLFDDKFDQFIDERALQLRERATALIK